MYEIANGIASGEIQLYVGWIWFAAIAVMAIGMLAAKQEGDEANTLAGFEAAQSEREAAERKSEAEAEARKIEREGRLLRGEQAAAAGGAGITQSGSVLDIIADDAMEVELQRQETLRFGRTAERAGSEEGQLTRRAGKRAKQTSILKGIGGAAGTAGQAAAAS